MRRLCAVLLVLPLLPASVAAHAKDQARTRYLTLVNRAYDSVVSLQVAERGSGAFREVPLGEALRGGGGSATVSLHGAGCVYDARFQFRDGRSLVYEGVDVCRYEVVRIRALPHGDAKAGAFVASFGK